ncbi:hypothetical protein PYW08_003510 [Mythimna loreyi]|uniref:Uncharacterized protein n=1 Tax=Mythimna loreyi TaxID=667449 RepID=A0ACC2QT45_9NEOP|nr:hypothetical protein PYW08_003510 [Mythimna loreyi]
MSSLFGLLAAWSVLWTGTSAAMSPVTLQHCCPPHHALSEDALRATELTPAAAAAACVPTVGNVTRATRIFSLQFKKIVYEEPKHWTNKTGIPECELLRLLPEHAAPYALRGADGLMMVRAAPGSHLPPDRYCTDVQAALVCADALLWQPAKCCAEGHAFDGKQCVAPDKASEHARDETSDHARDETSERAQDALDELYALINRSAVGPSKVVVGWPACPMESRYAVAGWLAGAQLERLGALLLSAAGGGGERLAGGAWCADAALGTGRARVFACEAAARARGPQASRHLLYGAGLAVGAAFLAATLAAGFALPAAHHALHWRCQTHYVAALMLGDALLAATQLAGDVVPPGLCRALAVCMHFLFLSAFFWLNTMCFNIWWTFRDFRPTSLERGQELWRLRVYMVYAWGGPLLLAGAAAALDALPAAAAAPFLRPRFAVQRCWFYGDMEILVYFFGPVGVLLLVNLALFISTTRQLTCGLWRRDEVKSTSERAALGRVCAKLVVVMGVTWGADVVSWAAGGPDYVWYATDLLNALQGVFIFLVVGCQPHAWAALKRAAAACCARGGAGGGGARNTHSSTHLPSCGESLTHTTPAPPAPAAARIPMETVC